MFTLGEQWTERYLAGVFLLHVLLGRDTAAVPMARPTQEGLVRQLNEIAGGKYDEKKYFAPKAAGKPSFTATVPALEPGRKYDLIVLNAVTDRNEKVSVTAGGVAFEDPLWAILAAYAISPYHRGAKPGLPIASSNAELWERAEQAARAIDGRTFQTDNFFHRVKGVIPPDTHLAFQMVEADAAKIEALRGRGLQTMPVGNEAKYFELYLK